MEKRHNLFCLISDTGHIIICFWESRLEALCMGDGCWQALCETWSKLLASTAVEITANDAPGISQPCPIMSCYLFILT